MSKTLLEVFALSELDEATPNEPETITIQIGSRLTKFRIHERHSCQHQNGRFGLLLILKKLKGNLYYEAFQTPQGDIEFLGESPEQDKSVKSLWTKPCRRCKAKGFIYDRIFERKEQCNKCHGFGYINIEQPKRKVTLI